MKFFLYVGFFALCLTISQNAFSQAWPATNEWDGMKTEIKFQKWFLDNITTDFFFKKTGLLLGQVPVDCGKAAYAARAIFAYEHGLRFYAIGRDNKPIDSNAGNYTGTPEQNLRSFLISQVVGRVNVESMRDNTFPLSVSRSTLTAGTVFNFQMPGYENSEAGRHVYIVKDISDGGYIKFIWATVPVVPRIMSERTLFPTYMPVDVSIHNQWGFRRFYQPNDYLEGKVLELKKLHRDKNTRERAETELTALLGSRGYDPDFQNNLAKEVYDDYNADKEDLRTIKPAPAPLRAATGNEQSKTIVRAEAMDYRTYWKHLGKWSRSFLDAPADFENKNYLNELLEARRINFHAELNRSSVDEMLDTARKAEEARQAKLKPPQPKLYNNLVFPELKKSGTFVTDPKVLVEGLSIIRIFHERLVYLLMKDKTKKETLEENLQRQYFNLCSYYEDRAAAVEEGFQYYFRSRNKVVSAPNKFLRCPTEDERYNYTTPNRDAEFTNYLLDLRRFYLSKREEIRVAYPHWFLTMEYSLAEPMDEKYFNAPWIETEMLRNAFLATRQFLPKGQKGNYCSMDLDLKDGTYMPFSIRNVVPNMLRSVNLVDKVQNIRANVPLISSAPHTSIRRRWGIDALTQSVFDVESVIDCVLVSAEQAQAAAEQKIEGKSDGGETK